MKSKNRKGIIQLFKGLTATYYIRQMLYGILIFSIFTYILFLFPDINYILLVIYIINTLLYPFSRFAYEIIIEYIIGNNIIFANIILFSLVKFTTMLLCWVFAIFITPIGLIIIYFHQNKGKPKVLRNITISLIIYTIFIILTNIVWEEVAEKHQHQQKIERAKEEKILNIKKDKEREKINAINIHNFMNLKDECSIENNINSEKCKKYFHLNKKKKYDKAVNNLNALSYIEFLAYQQTCFEGKGEKLLCKAHINIREERKKKEITRLIETYPNIKIYKNKMCKSGLMYNEIKCRIAVDAEIEQQKRLKIEINKKVEAYYLNKNKLKIDFNNCYKKITTLKKEKNWDEAREVERSNICITVLKASKRFKVFSFSKPLQ